MRHHQLALVGGIEQIEPGLRRADLMFRRLDRVEAQPQIASPRWLSFSASSFAVTMPVESRTQLISISGLSASNAALNLAMCSTSSVL
jgi:hypothetical protein